MEAKKINFNKIKIEPYPFGKQFAISIIDDTDGATANNVSPIYDYLIKKNIICTKTVWPLKPTSISGNYPQIPQFGETLQDENYLNFCIDLEKTEFEIAMHTASAGNSERKRTIEAYDLFEDIFGYPPATNIMHSRNIENIYWGKNCISNPLISKAISILEPIDFCGHNKSSKYYWGDVCKSRTKYIRQFETLSPNTLSFDPATPYHDPLKPDVNWWFSATYGEGVRLFKVLDDENIQNLAEKRGASIIHLYLRQYNIDGKLSSRFKGRISALEERNEGWYVPVKVLLDRLIAIRKLSIKKEGYEILITNNSDETIKKLAIYVSPQINLFLDRDLHIPLIKNNLNQINLGDLQPNESISIFSHIKLDVSNKKVINPQTKKLLAGYALRFIWQFLKGRPGLFYQEDLPWAKEVI